MVFNAIFNNIPVMSWLSVSLMEETTYLPRVTAKIVVIRSRKIDNTMTKRNRIKGNQWSTKDYTENGRLSNKNPTKRVWTQVLRKGDYFLLHWWHPSCYTKSSAISFVPFENGTINTVVKSIIATSI